MCPNYWCARRDRGFDLAWAIGPYRGWLRRAILGLKYRREARYLQPLADLLSGYLLDRSPCFEDIDVIVAMAGPHVVAVVDAASAALEGLWPVAPPVVKVCGTRPMARMDSSGARRLWAAGELRHALRVTEPAVVQGRRVLAVDDVFTDGSTLRETAGVLRGAGATSVVGLVLARAPGGRSGL